MKLLILLFASLVSASGTIRHDTNEQTLMTQEDENYGDQPTSYFEHNSLRNKFNRKLTYGQYLSYSQRALSLIAGFDSDLHRYDSKDDLIESFERNLSYRDDLSKMRAHIDRRELSLLEKQNELTLIENELNQSKCGHQLDYLISRIQHIMTNYTTFYDSKELDIMDLMDSFGSPESELMMGNSAWFGSYHQCQEANFIMTYNNEVHREDTIYGRYCVAKFEMAPPEAPENGSSSFVKMAVCLPRSCNSISILRHGEQIELLAKLVRLNYIPHSGYKLSNLYCLPDANSPLRQFSLSAKLFILTLSSWITIVVYFSLKYEYILMIDRRYGRCETTTVIHQDRLLRALAFRLSWSNLFTATGTTSGFSEPKFNLMRLTALASLKKDNKETGEKGKARNLLETLKSQDHSLIATDGKRTSSLVGDTLVCVANSEPGNPSSGKAIDLTAPSKTQQLGQKNPSIDLSVMDGIKVVSMIWLIMAHTLLFFIRTIANGREFWSLLRDARFLTVMAGIFPVDTFFTVTGVLTAYLKFNKQEAIHSPKYWLEAFVHRYLRFMPMYLMVFWFTRDVSEYIGSGPLWDYSTANTSLRSVCKQESFSVPLLFQANFKPLDHHCVKPAWYLANDYQFLLVTPIFMMLIMKSASLGYSVMILSIICSLVAQFITVFYSQEMEDFGALVNFKPMFATYVLKNLWQLYVLPYNRIPPYLIGLLTGHLMHSRAQSSKNGNHREQRSTIGGDQSAASKTTIEPSYPYQDSIDSPADSSSDNDQVVSQDQQSTGHESTSNILKSTSSSACNLSDYLCSKVWTPLVFLISIIYLPMLTKLVTHEGMAARIGTSTIIALMRFVWSLATARLIYVAATRFLVANPLKRADSFVVRFLASPMWKPWSKIGLSALLIQWEVIGYMAQTQTGVPDMSMTFLLATMLACILVTYLLAILIYLTVEYPLSQFEQLYIIPALFRK